MKALRYPFILLAFMGATLGRAQEISFKASVDRNSIAVGEQIQLTLTLANGGDRFEAPDLGGLVIVGGPRTGSNVSINNGRMSSSISKTWWLTATTPGKYTIGSSKLRIGNATIATDPITVEVVKGDQSGTGAQTQQQRSNSNIFATMDLSRSKAYVGEQVVLTYTLFTRYGQLEPMGNEVPALNGFWSEEIDLGQVALNQVVTVNGIQYYKAVIKKQLLIPQRSGKLRIAPAKFSFRASTGWFGQGSQVDAIANAVEFNS
ncbi:MAG TPA: BatD family protein, partial [Flavobacteriales bacterium]|nr:BatD family protein [Flavobacteriales bacterium]